MMNRTVEVLMHNINAGKLSETDKGYKFEYYKTYVENENATPVSQTLPLQLNAYESFVLFPFFDGLIPEGWLLELAEKNWKLQSKDRFGLLAACCKNCIGAVSVIHLENEKL